MDYEGSLAVLTKIENEISKRFQINLKNIEILNIRSQLVACNNSISKYKLNPELEKDNKAIKTLNSKDGLEKFAREEYYMKRDSEEIYIIEYEDSLKTKDDD